MVVKQYELGKTAKTMAKRNGLILSPYNSPIHQQNVYYDFSLLDNIQFENDYEREVIQDDLMKYHTVSWYQQPLPGGIQYDNFTTYYYHARTVAHKVYNDRLNKRMMVIIELVKIDIDRSSRRDVWSNFETECSYSAENNHAEGRDIEI